MNIKKSKRILLYVSLLALVFVLAGCGTGAISENSTGFWDRYVLYYFSNFIKFLSKITGGNYGVGIIVFTLIIRTIMLPLVQWQTKGMKKQQDLQPQIKALQEKYSSKDTETQQKLREEQQKLMSEAGVNPVAGCLPVLIQLPIMTALYGAIARTPELQHGKFLWLQLGESDPYFILPILAAIFTFLTTWLSSKSQVESNSMTKIMMIGMPIFIFFAAWRLQSAISLYWVISNAYSVGQTMLFNNPYKAQREIAEKEQKKRDMEKAMRKAIKNSKKRK